jgi:hypothetical protein
MYDGILDRNPYLHHACQLLGTSYYWLLLTPLSYCLLKVPVLDATHTAIPYMLGAMRRYMQRIFFVRIALLLPL